MYEDTKDVWVRLIILLEPSLTEVLILALDLVRMTLIHSLICHTFYTYLLYFKNIMILSLHLTPSGDINLMEL